MNDIILAVRYARGYVNSISPGTETESFTALKNFSDTLLQSISVNKEKIRLIKVLTTPTIRLDKRTAIFEKLLKQAGGSMTFKRFCKILFRKKRLPLLPKICSYSNELLNHRTNTIIGTVRSPFLPSPAVISEMEAIFSEKHNGNVKLSPQTDASLIGGVVVRIKDKVYDGSLSNKLNRFIESL